jgi:hypothetical protein
MMSMLAEKWPLPHWFGQFRSFKPQMASSFQPEDPAAVSRKRKSSNCSPPWPWVLSFGASSPAHGVQPRLSRHLVFTTQKFTYSSFKTRAYTSQLRRENNYPATQRNVSLSIICPYRLADCHPTLTIQSTIGLSRQQNRTTDCPSNPTD